mmetsp:Transcript_77625/g.152335  ORF Transcript_77625/g.152335 Transcript_77625/m.152335 type:complete len:228 (-) Transcript_77625:2-685(-)
MAVSFCPSSFFGSATGCISFGFSAAGCGSDPLPVGASLSPASPFASAAGGFAVGVAAAGLDCASALLGVTASLGTARFFVSSAGEFSGGVAAAGIDAALPLPDAESSVGASLLGAAASGASPVGFEGASSCMGAGTSFCTRFVVASSLLGAGASVCTCLAETSAVGTSSVDFSAAGFKGSSVFSGSPVSFGTLSALASTTGDVPVGVPAAGVESISGPLGPGALSCA